MRGLFYRTVSIMKIKKKIVRRAQRKFWFRGTFQNGQYAYLVHNVDIVQDKY